MSAKPKLWPVMLTPFTREGEVDYASLEKLIAWYEANGVDGLFAVCQSSEIHYLSLKERVTIARFVKEHAHVPVIASGHVSDGFDDQLEELKAIAATGVDALIMITNRLVLPGRQEESIIPRVERIMAAIPRSCTMTASGCIRSSSARMSAASGISLSLTSVFSVT